MAGVEYLVTWVSIDVHVRCAWHPLIHPHPLLCWTMRWGCCFWLMAYGSFGREHFVFLCAAVCHRYPDQSGPEQCKLPYCTHVRSLLSGILWFSYELSARTSCVQTEAFSASCPCSGHECLCAIKTILLTLSTFDAFTLHVAFLYSKTERMLIVDSSLKAQYAMLRMGSASVGYYRAAEKCREAVFTRVWEKAWWAHWFVLM